MKTLIRHALFAGLVASLGLAAPAFAQDAMVTISSPAEGAKLFNGKPTAVVGASPGGFGTVRSQAALLPVLHAFGSDLWMAGELLVSKAGAVFDADGKLVDDKVRGQLQQFVQGFADFVKKRVA